ncbi:93e8bd63-570d-4511-9513-c12c9d3b2f2f [Thermothielavioides terrestris]|uniref:93e8bd63-570d-4511-9513-c12c9d3b2f2f n=1 Tax=Thermothielavioides terrestris TaxID=2587410 RepID=A0A3S4AMW3_9PEZI|nr:93e8bd63-570d-4511-9513-c12c9d3b2f2f [Thermothielavioides terrestris]
MDNASNRTPRSAVDVMRQLQAEVFEAANAAANKSPTEQPLSAVEELNRQIGVNIDMHAENAALGDHGMELQPPPTTVAPADLTTSMEQLSAADNDLSSGGVHQFLGGTAERAVHTPPDVEPERSPPEMGSGEQEDDDINGRHFTVTLPMAANTRAIYLDTISENRATMISFGEVFANSHSQDPEASLVVKMDNIFEQLLKLCDLPAYDDSLSGLGKDEMMKHATNTNSKFSFVYEFLGGLWDINGRVMILSQPGRVFEYMEAVVSATGLPFTILGQDVSGQQPMEGMSVILAVAGQDLSMVQGGVDVVILFDHTARSVHLPATLGYESMAPIVLSLVATYSLEHIDQQLLEVEQDLDDLERKNALNLATVTAGKYLRNPQGRRYPEPHQAASIFADFLKNPESGLDWEPHPLPSDVFEIWLSSQERTQTSQDQAHLEDVSNGTRSRKRASDNVDEGTPKRPRLLPESRQPSRNPTPARMSELLKKTLASFPIDASAPAQVVEVPVEQLERMADKIAELEARLATQNNIESKLREHMISLESQLRSYERTVQSIQPKYMDALRDRGTFEKECKVAVDEANAAKKRLEAQKTEVETLKERNKLLESKLAEANATLANSTIPEIAKLAQAEKERDEAVAAAEKLEKKVRSLQNEVEYTRKAYQDASNAHSELNQENQELKSMVANLERRASENLLKIHEIHARNQTAEISRQVDELQATLENRERELERAKEELKVLKNGRRETRQVSVPRSPRPGVMSPRPGRGISGSGSRGTSPSPLMSSDGPGGIGTGGGGGGGGSGPVPGMTFFPTAGNGGRWGYLRD